MQGNRSYFLTALLLVLAMIFVSPLPAVGQTYNVLFRFNGTTAGAEPLAGVILDQAGNLYGTASEGGTGVCMSGNTNIGCGLVFELAPPATQGGAWAQNVIYNFGASGTDGNLPHSALIFDNRGNLYGTTEFGGAFGMGTVFELSPPSSGSSWTETIVHSFGKGTDGANPIAGLALDGSGNLYGTTYYGGKYVGCLDLAGISHSCGTAYVLTPVSGGGWTYKTIHHFGHGSDGNFPWSGVTLDADGNLYGTASFGGEWGTGILYKLLAGTWTWKLIHPFGNPQGAVNPVSGCPTPMLVSNAFPPPHGPDGTCPFGGLIFTPSADAPSPIIWGTTRDGGLVDGTIFQFTQIDTGNGWVEHNPSGLGGGSKPLYPMANLNTDVAGNIYGTSMAGGTAGLGTVFELTENAKGWKQVNLHNFAGGTADGAASAATLVMDSNGNLYGTTIYGGKINDHGCEVLNPSIPGCGVIFEITP